MPTARIWQLLLSTALIAIAMAACKPECSTDRDCPDGALCLNSLCRPRSSGGVDAGAHDAGPVTDATADRVISRGDADVDRTMAQDRTRPDLLAHSDRRGAADGGVADTAVTTSDSGPDIILLGAVGDPCAGDEDCALPADLCLTGFPAGYCSASCDMNATAPCGAFAACFCLRRGADGCLEAQCFRTCYAYSDCREAEGYVCEESVWLEIDGPEYLCYPAP